jgi:hypothetical protein
VLVGIGIGVAVGTVPAWANINPFSLSVLENLGTAGSFLSLFLNFNPPRRYPFEEQSHACGSGSGHPHLKCIVMLVQQLSGGHIVSASGQQSTKH